MRASRATTLPEGTRRPGDRGHPPPTRDAAPALDLLGSERRCLVPVVLPAPIRRRGLIRVQSGEPIVEYAGPVGQMYSGGIEGGTSPPLSKPFVEPPSQKRGTDEERMSTKGLPG